MGACRPNSAESTPAVESSLTPSKKIATVRLR